MKYDAYWRLTADGGNRWGLYYSPDDTYLASLEFDGASYWYDCKVGGTVHYHERAVGSSPIEAKRYVQNVVFGLLVKESEELAERVNSLTSRLRAIYFMNERDDDHGRD